MLTIENTYSDLKVYALHYAMSYLYALDFPFRNFCKLAQPIQKNVWEKSSETCSLSIRVQTTINHISICFSPQYQRKYLFSERELKKALRDTLREQRGMESYRQRQITYIHAAETVLSAVTYMHTFIKVSFTGLFSHSPTRLRA